MANIRKSFSSKLSLSLLLLATPIFMASLGVLFSQSRHIIRKEAVGCAQSALKATMQRLHQKMLVIETATDANYWLLTQQPHPDAMLGLSRSIVWMNSQVDGCSVSAEPYVFPEHGRYYSAYTIREGDSIITTIEQPYEYFEKVWYKTPRTLNAPCWVAYFDDTDSLNVVLDGMIASYGRPLYDASQHFFGIISTDISLLRLSKVITSEEKPYPNAYFIMVDEEGHYFIHPDASQLFTHTIFEGANPGKQDDLITLGHEMTSGNEGSMTVVMNGASCLVCYQPVPGTKWSLALVCPDSDVLAGYYRLTLIVPLLLLAGLIIILLLCRRAVAHAISPLYMLLSKTQSIAEGNMEVHIPKTHRKDVIGSLQNSFSNMLHFLQFHIGSVSYTTEQARERNEKLRQATLMAEKAGQQKTAFIQNVTHQIRTPLNIIMGFAQITSHETPLSDDEKSSIANMMIYNSQLLNRIVLMLYDCSETGKTDELKNYKSELVACNAVARESMEFIHDNFPDIDVKLQTDVDDCFCIHASHLYLMRSLREVLFNSAKYSDGKFINLKINVNNNKVHFIVEDQGKGIAEDHREFIFNFFTKVDDLSEGLGLGLPLAKRHTQNMGGDLTLDTSYHNGSRFIIELPLD